MGTHPIFESDFDCLTEKMVVEEKMRSNVLRVTPKKEEKPEAVDREKTCPLLLRVFTSKDRHHRPDDFSRNQTPSNELQVYTWMDASLKGITNLVKEVHPEARKKGTVFDFAICYQDNRMNRYRIKDIGQTVSGKKSADDGVTLKSSKFQIGDFMDIAIREPRAMRDDRRGDRRNFRRKKNKNLGERFFTRKNIETRFIDCPCNFRKFLHFVSSIDSVVFVRLR